MAIKLLIANHHEVIRVGLRSIASQAKINVVAEAGNSTELVRLIRKHKPDVVLLGPLADEVGLQALASIKTKKPDLPVLMLQADDNPTFTARSLALGASGCIPQDCSRARLLSAVQDAAAGRNAWTEQQLQRLTGRPTIPANVEVRLTPRQLDVVHQLTFGLTNREIAQQLGISIETAKEHMQDILRRTGIADRTAVAVWAIRNGLG